MGDLFFRFSFTQTDWISQVYLPENHARLKAAHTYVSGELRDLGIPFLSRGAGFFIWVDLRKVTQVELQVGGSLSLPPVGEEQGRLPLHPELLLPSQYLPEATFEEEMLLWRRFLDNKVLLSFGKAFECKEPGWFRLVFSDKAHRLRLGEPPAFPAPLLTASFCPPSSGPTWGPGSLSLVLPSHPAISADRILTSPSQECRGSGGCWKANPRWQKSPLPVRPRSQGASTVELVIAPWPCGHRAWQPLLTWVFRASETVCG